MKLIEEVRERVNSKLDEAIGDICKEYSLKPEDINLQLINDNEPLKRGLLDRVIYNVRLKSTGVTICRININLKTDYII